MPIPKEIEELFYAGKRGNIVHYGINDSVEVVSGEFVGLSGSVISILEVEPEVILLVERGDTGFDIKVKQNQLTLID